MAVKVWLDLAAIGGWAFIGLIRTIADSKSPTWWRVLCVFTAPCVAYCMWMVARRLI